MVFMDISNMSDYYLAYRTTWIRGSDPVNDIIAKGSNTYEVGAVVTNDMKKHYGENVQYKPVGRMIKIVLDTGLVDTERAYGIQQVKYSGVGDLYAAFHISYHPDGTFDSKILRSVADNMSDIIEIVIDNILKQKINDIDPHSMMDMTINGAYGTKIRDLSLKELEKYINAADIYDRDEKNFLKNCALFYFPKNNMAQFDHLPDELKLELTRLFNRPNLRKIRNLLVTSCVYVDHCDIYEVKKV